MSETSPRTGAWLTTQRLVEETGLSPAELAALPLDEYARLTGRPTIGQLAQDATAYAPTTPPGRPRPAPQAAPQPPAAPDAGRQLTAEDIDWSQVDADTYARIRADLIKPQTIHGGAQNGRHPLLTAGVEAPRRIQADYSARDAETERLQALNADRQAAFRRQGYGY